MAKPFGTLTPLGVNSRYISPSEAFFPPTSATSPMPISSNQRMWGLDARLLAIGLAPSVIVKNRPARGTNPADKAPAEGTLARTKGVVLTIQRARNNREHAAVAGRPVKAENPVELFLRAAVATAGAGGATNGRFTASDRQSGRHMKKPHSCTFARRGDHGRGWSCPSRATTRPYHSQFACCVKRHRRVDRPNSGEDHRVAGRKVPVRHHAGSDDPGAVFLRDHPAGSGRRTRNRDCHTGGWVFHSASIRLIIRVRRAG